MPRGVIRFLFQRVQQNRRERGAKLVVIDPRRTATATRPICISRSSPAWTTAPVLRPGWCGLPTADVFDRCYVGKHTNGFERR
jgi:assimilatory nitrate reductase catalytic subunit